jgi:hypothetical protein
MSWVTIMTVSRCRATAGDELVHVQPHAGIERAERLVQQQDARPLDQGLGDRQALLHAARHLGRIEVELSPRPTAASIASASSAARRRAPEEPGGEGRPRIPGRTSRCRSADRCGNTE